MPPQELFDAGPDANVEEPSAVPIDAGLEAEAAAPAPLVCVACVNAGGGGVTASTGRAFLADTGANAGEAYTSPNAVNNTNDGALYQSERFGNAFTYTFEVPNGSYTLNLHFAEVFWTQTGQRVFHVDVQGARVLDNYDMLQEVAANTPIVKTFNVTVTDGSFTVAFTTVVDNAKVSAIELLGR